MKNRLALKCTGGAKGADLTPWDWDDIDAVLSSERYFVSFIPPRSLAHEQFYQPLTERDYIQANLIVREVLVKREKRGDIDSQYING